MKRSLAVLVFAVLTFAPGINALAQESGRTDRLQKVEKIERSGIEFDNAQAFSDGNGVLINWRTTIETRNLGFLVYRITGGQTVRVSPSLIPGAYLKTKQEVAYGDQYEFFDHEGDFRSAYYVQSIDTTDKTQDSGLIYPREVDDLSAVVGRSAGSYRARLANATPEIEGSKAGLPGDLKRLYEANDSLSDINTQRLIAAMPGAKIAVKREGFYRVTRADLQNAGFDVNSDPTTWKLYLQGIEQAIIVGDGGSYVEFYGKGADTTENDKKIYYLVAGGNAGKRINTSILTPLSNVVGSTYKYNFVRKDRLDYFGNLLNGDTENFFGSVVAPNSTTSLNFVLTGTDDNNPKCTFEIYLQGISTIPHNVLVTLNGFQLNPITGVGPRPMSGRYEITTEFLRDGNNTIQLTSTSGSSLVESFKISYNRRYLAQSNQLSFYTNNYRTTTVNGFTSPNVRVFDLTYPYEPKLIMNASTVKNAGNYSVRIPAHRSRVMYSVEDSAILQADSVTQNFPSTLSTPANNAQLVIISHKNFLSVSEDWANYRRGQGFTAKVVDISDVFDEFSYGENYSLAIRDFLQYAKNNWQTPPQYVMLMGDASFDPRDYLGYSVNFVPTKLVDTIFTETGSDETLADFDDDGLAEISIGRISIRTPAEATTILNKVITFEQTSAQGFGRGFLFAYDLPNGYDFLGVSQRLAATLPANVTKTFVGREMPNPQTLLINDMNAGRFMINYAGHGNAKDWVNPAFFGYSVVPQLNNSGIKLSVFNMLTCLNGYFVDPAPNRESLSEYLVKYSNGGAVATWSSTGLTTPDIQEVMATRFYTQLTEGSMIRMGDLIRDAKSVIVGGRDVRLSWTLLGDPMLKVR